MSGQDLGTYQMLWDCEFCGTNKLLGVTHRFCPNCGSAQNPDKRYFPSDEEKIALENHEYHGVDVICAACKTPNSAKAEFCFQCGSPLTEGAKAVIRTSESRGMGEKFQAGQARDLVKERFEAQMQPIKAAKTASKSGFLNWKTGLIVGGLGLVVLCVAVVGALFFWNKDASVMVSAHSWEREIRIEDFAARSEGDWCDNMPGDAYSVSRSERVRSQRQVQDGETCRDVRVDNGDGSFSERRECTPKYRSEDVYDTYCSYTVDRWGYERSVITEGNSLNEEPIWGNVTLSRTGECIGCERESNDREQHYYVHFKDSESGKEYKCDFDQDKWGTFPIESRWVLSVSVVTGDADCDNVKQAN